MTTKAKRTNAGPLTREEVITEFRLMAADAHRRGYHSFEEGWTRAADRLEAGEPLGTVIDVETDNVEPNPDQLDFGFDVDLDVDL